MLRNYGKIEWIEDLSMDYNISLHTSSNHLSFNNRISIKLEIRFLII